MGWSGTCVEPSPAPLAALLERHKDRRDRVSIVDALLLPRRDGSPRPVDFHVTSDGMSTFDREIKAKWESACNYQLLRKIAFPLDWVLSRLDKYDFISVDTEGSSYKVAQALKELLLPENTKGTVWCIEHDGETAAPFDGKVLLRNAENVIIQT
jgi:hypothetical protein